MLIMNFFECSNRPMNNNNNNNHQRTKIQLRMMSITSVQNRDTIASFIACNNRVCQSQSPKPNDHTKVIITQSNLMI